jgi:hypothetical protein
LCNNAKVFKLQSREVLEMATQVTLELLKGYLERFGWHRYKAVDEPSEKEGIIYTGWRSSEAPEGYNMAIDPMVERNCLSFKVPNVLVAPRDTTPAERLAELLMAMGFINYRIILGKFAYDPRDGEVRFSVDVPIDENDLSYEQFQHCMGVAVTIVEEYAPKLRAIVAGEKTAQQFLEEELGSEAEMAAAFGQLLRELLERLEQELRQRREGQRDEPLEEV